MDTARSLEMLVSECQKIQRHIPTNATLNYRFSNFTVHTSVALTVRPLSRDKKEAHFLKWRFCTSVRPSVRDPISAIKILTDFHEILCSIPL